MKKLLVMTGLFLSAGGTLAQNQNNKETVVVINRPDGSQVVYVNGPNTLKSYEVKAPVKTPEKKSK